MPGTIVPAVRAYAQRINQSQNTARHDSQMIKTDEPLHLLSKPNFSATQPPYESLINQLGCACVPRQFGGGCAGLPAHPCSPLSLAHPSSMLHVVDFLTAKLAQILQALRRVVCQKF